MENRGAPISSIEIQIYKACIQAKSDGFERLIFGESADSVFGGLNQLLSKDWLIGDFIDRYVYVKPYKVLKDSILILDPFIKHEKNGHIDPHEFISTEFFNESVASYINASSAANCEIVLPYSECTLSAPIDYNLIRSGKNKYIVREVFQKLFPHFEIPPKTPMPRPTSE